MPRLQREVVFASILVLLAAAMARPAVAQDIKLGYVDGEKVVQAYKGYKDAVENMPTGNPVASI